MGCCRCPVAPTGSNGFWSFMIFIHTRPGVQPWFGLACWKMLVSQQASDQEHLTDLTWGLLQAPMRMEPSKIMIYMWAFDGIYIYLRPALYAIAFHISTGGVRSPVLSVLVPRLLLHHEAGGEWDQNSMWKNPWIAVLLWNFGTWILYSSIYWEYLSSSQVTKSYFSEGYTAQPPTSV